MENCHDGVSICLQFLASNKWPFFWTFQGCLYKKLSEQFENIQKTVTEMLKTIPVEDFQCYQEWEQYLHLCVAAQGKYFEGDNIDVWKK